MFFVFFVRHLAFAVVALRSASTDIALPGIDGDDLPSVSVLVGCKDEESVVAELVAGSMLSTTPVRLELFVVDDGSTDRTGALLDAAATANPRGQSCTGLRAPAAASRGR